MSSLRASFLVFLLTAGCGAPDELGGQIDRGDAEDGKSDSVKRPRPSASPWDGREACLASIASGRRAPAPAQGHVSARVTTWNARWFPIGHAPFDASAVGEPTDVQWLACAVLWMGADILVLEEVLGSDLAKTKLEELRRAIQQLDGGDTWSSRVLECADPDLQRIAVFYRTDPWGDVTLLDAESLKLSASGSSVCSASARPALLLRFDYRGSALTLAGLHLKSGRDAYSYGLRRAQMTRLIAGLAEERADRLVVLGDFNSMGCHDCMTASNGGEEIDLLSSELAAGGFERAAPDPGCSQYTSGKPRLLDHIAVRGTGALVARVDGPCRELACGGFDGATPPAFATLSDHCPMTIDLPLED